MKYSLTYRYFWCHTRWDNNGSFTLNQMWNSQFC